MKYCDVIKYIFLIKKMILIFLLLIIISTTHQYFSFNKFYKLDEIIKNLKEYQEKHSDNLKIFDLNQIVGEMEGITTLGNQILGISFEYPKNETLTRKPIVLVISTIHGRDWFATSCALYLIDQLTKMRYHQLLKYEWIIIPILNPDGYFISMSDRRLRHWTKNWRKNPQGECRGIDLDRNFEYQWMDNEETSLDFCHELYSNRVFSEYETRVLSSFINTLPKTKLKIHIAIKEGDPAVLFPYAYTSQDCKDFDNVNSIAKKAAYFASKMDSENNPWKYGQTGKIFLKKSAGFIEDWMRFHFGIKKSFAIQMININDSEVNAESKIRIKCRAVYEAIKILIDS